MNNRNGLLLCSTAALLALAAPGYAATTPDPTAAPLPDAQSYAELLAPIENAAAVLKADDARRTAEPAPVQVAQYYHHHHHHHHHHHFPLGFYGGGTGPYYYGAAPCYWTWGAPVWNGYRWVRQHVRVCD